MVRVVREPSIPSQISGMFSQILDVIEYLFPIFLPFFEYAFYHTDITCIPYINIHLDAGAVFSDSGNLVKELNEERDFIKFEWGTN
ncbi:Hypothetical predicted protein [Octopus vulgaris]|uniref:Uncharacterized protein n=1 Tax=Octopus vulgaris TaxID=6645 RepID=A0AA36BC89_OCTVU|nr:Hypothetical predicted protein [Octopus vulgaris]